MEFDYFTSSQQQSPPPPQAEAMIPLSDNKELEKQIWSPEFWLLHIGSAHFPPATGEPLNLDQGDFDRSAMEVVHQAYLSLKKTQSPATITHILHLLKDDSCVRTILLHFSHCIIRTYLCWERFNQLSLYLMAKPGIRHQRALSSTTIFEMDPVYPKPSASEQNANEMSMKIPYILLLLLGILTNLGCPVISQGNNKRAKASDIILRFEASLTRLRDGSARAYNNLTPMFDILYKELAPESEEYRLMQSADCVRVKYLANFLRDVRQSVCYLHSENPEFYAVLQKLTKAIDPYNLLSSPTDCDDAGRMNQVLEFMTRFKFTNPNFLSSHQV